MSESRLKVFSGNSNRVLAEDICRNIGIPLGEATVTSFPDGETFVKIDENIRGHDVFIIQSTCPPTNHHLMELLIMIDAARRASAQRITAVLPFYGYARQDRKDQPRVPITAKLVANLLVSAGANRVLTMDLHSQQIQGFFDIPVDHLYASPVFFEYLSKTKQREPGRLLAGRRRHEDGGRLRGPPGRQPRHGGQEEQERHDRRGDQRRRRGRRLRRPPGR
jgi:ribose-phosphate pyrophosphokinase